MLLLLFLIFLLTYSTFVCHLQQQSLHIRDPALVGHRLTHCLCEGPGMGVTVRADIEVSVQTRYSVGHVAHVGRTSGRHQSRVVVRQELHTDGARILPVEARQCAVCYDVCHWFVVKLVCNLQCHAMYVTMLSSS